MMFNIGMLIACSLTVTVKVEDIPFIVKDNSAYGVVKGVGETKLVVDFSEHTNKNKKLVGDYSKVIIESRECIPMEEE